MRFVTAIDTLNRAGYVTPLLCDLLCFMPIEWTREEDARRKHHSRIETVSHGGWVRKTGSPDRSWYGFVVDKPPSPNISLFSPFGLGIPLIPFLWLYKDTKSILKIIIIWVEMRFVHRWVSLFCWVCNFWNGGGWYRKMRFVHNADQDVGTRVKKNFFSGVSNMCRQLGSGTNQLGIKKASCEASLCINFLIRTVFLSSFLFSSHA